MWFQVLKNFENHLIEKNTRAEIVNSTFFIQNYNPCTCFDKRFKIYSAELVLNENFKLIRSVASDISRLAEGCFKVTHPTSGIKNFWISKKWRSRVVIDHRNFGVEIARISTQSEIQTTRAPLIGDSSRAPHFGSPTITPDPRPSFYFSP